VELAKPLFYNSGEAFSSVFAPVEHLITAAVDVSLLRVLLAGASVSFVAILSPSGSQLVDLRRTLISVEVLADWNGHQALSRKVCPCLLV
jgi:hypothetical protein